MKNITVLIASISAWEIRIKLSNLDKAIYLVYAFCKNNIKSKVTVCFE